MGVRARRAFADPLRVLRMGGRPSHLIFRELRACELRGIPLPRTPLNRARRERQRLFAQIPCSSLRRLVASVSDLGYRTRAASTQVVQFAVLAYLQVHDAA